MSISILIDPGHQETPDFALEPIYPGAVQGKPKCAPGTEGLVTKTKESETALTISMLLKRRLYGEGYTVLMTRDRNDVRISNIERAEMANQAGVDLCIKIHCNGVRRGLRFLAFLRRGAMTLVPSIDHVAGNLYKRTKEIAEIIHKNYIEATGLPDRGIVERGDIAGFNWSRVPTILLELGYLTNPIEDRLLNNSGFQEKIVSAIVGGIKDAEHVIVLP